jgi:solute carrier family 35, member F5
MASDQDVDILQSRRWTVGLAFLAVVVTLWVASGFMVNAISAEYSKPCFITYCNTGTFVVYLLPTVWRKYSRGTYRELAVSDGENEVPLDHGSKSANQPMPLKETAILASQFSVLWYLSNLFNNASYIYTTVASATILSCTSSFFTLIVGSMFGIERFTLSKFGALIISILGIWMITTAEDKSESAPESVMLGNIFALGGAFLYGVYTTLLKVKVGDESRLDVKVFLGFVGLFNLVALWPILILLNYVGIETFGLPGSSWVWSLLIVNAISTLVSDFSWVLAMLMTSPLVLSATIPISMLGDRIINGHYGSFLYYTGAILVAWAFFAINKEEKEVEHTSESLTV